MNFKDYKDTIKDLPFTETPEYTQAMVWLHPERLPLGLLSLGDDPPAIIKIPIQATNQYGRKVPVIAISRNAFAGHDTVTDIILPPSLDAIPEGAFSGCSGLKRIAIPKSIQSIRAGTFEGCDALEDVYYEGTMEEWKKIHIVHNRHEIEFGPPIPGTPVHEIKAERLAHVPGNDALMKAGIHFRCSFYEPERTSGVEIIAGGENITALFRTM